MTDNYTVNISSQELKAIKRAIDLMIYTSKDEDRIDADIIAEHYDAFIQRNKITPKKESYSEWV